MARIRTVKPEFWTNGRVLECSTNVRLLFIGLWNFCDDTGRHPYRAKQIKAQVFPSDDFTSDDILGMLQELEDNGLITAYTVDNERFFYINGWEHQRIDKPQPSRYPDPFQDHSKNDPGTFPPDRIGKDSKGKEGKGYIYTFEEFWTDYPRKVGKAKAKTSFSKIAQKHLEDIKTDLASRPTSDPQWVQEGGKYVPNPATYLNQERWQDQWTPKSKEFGETTSRTITNLREVSF